MKRKVQSVQVASVIRNVLNLHNRGIGLFLQLFHHHFLHLLLILLLREESITYDLLLDIGGKETQRAGGRHSHCLESQGAAALKRVRQKTHDQKEI